MHYISGLKKNIIYLKLFIVGIFLPLKPKSKLNETNVNRIVCILEIKVLK